MLLSFFNISLHKIVSGLAEHLITSPDLVVQHGIISYKIKMLWSDKEQ